MFRRNTGFARAAALAAVAVIAACLLAGLSGCGKKTGKAPELKNGSFESVGASGIPADWERKVYFEAGSTVEAVQDASRGSVAHIAAAEGNDARLCQTVSVEPDTGYRLSCYIRTSGVEGGAGANIGVYGIALTSQPIYGDKEWQLAELVGRTAEGQTELTVSVGIGGHGALATGEAWFDDFKIEKTSVSSSVLLGTGSSSSNTAPSGERSALFPTGGIIKWSFICTGLLLVIWMLHLYYARKPLRLEDKSSALWVILILVAALALRIVLALMINGHKTDINCFVFWGRRLAENGPARFYGEMVEKDGAMVFQEHWCDYPPGYMLALGLMSKIGTWLGVPQAGWSILAKIPCIIVDLACAYLVFAYAKRRMSRGAALTLMAIAAFTPVIAYVSSAWGQIDQVLSLLLVVPILLLYDRRPVWAGIVYGLAIVTKPQALMAGPLFAAAYLIYVIKGSPYKKAALNRGTARLLRAKADSVTLRLAETVLAVLGAVAVIAAVSIPFTGDQPWYWLFKKYYGTATSYSYATVNAYNFWALIGANWKSTDIPFMGLTYGKWGTVFMAVSVILGIAVYLLAVLRHKSCKGALPLAMAFMFSGIFTFGHYMHERYVFPVLLLLLFAYIFYNDRRLLWSYLVYATTILVNCFAAFYYSENMELYKQNGYDGNIIFNYDLITICSIGSMIAFLLLAYVTIDLAVRNKPLRGYNG